LTMRAALHWHPCIWTAVLSGGGVSSYGSGAWGGSGFCRPGRA